mmetsp:Transcript_31821/g.48805  ORF Transcript_31821/g.48805 Transcript_31821/m.48805 type:complete len:368 (+) Transcript_31821:125-1228(+)
MIPELVRPYSRSKLFLRSAAFGLSSSILLLARSNPAAAAPGAHFAFMTTNARRSFHTSPINLADRKMSLLQKSDPLEEDQLVGEEWDAVLPFEDGSHNAAKIVIPPVVELEESSVPDPFLRSTFAQRMEATIATCRELHKSSIWIEVPMSRAGLIEDLANFNLKFHHAEGDTANLCLWLKDDSDNKIPNYATHQVGVGAFVVNSRDEILCVRELRRNYYPWKVPGGLAELGEHLDEAVTREVLEETGVHCNFHSVLSVRHTHGLQFGRSDLYFMCRLEPVEEVDDEGNAVIPEPVAQENEIERVAWIPLAEYKEMINNPERAHPTMQRVMEVYDQDCAIERSVVSSIVPGRKASPIYHASLSGMPQK